MTSPGQPIFPRLYHILSAKGRLGKALSSKTGGTSPDQILLKEFLNELPGFDGVELDSKYYRQLEDHKRWHHPFWKHWEVVVV